MNALAKRVAVALLVVLVVLAGAGCRKDSGGQATNKVPASSETSAPLATTTPTPATTPSATTELTAPAPTPPTTVTPPPAPVPAPSAPAPKPKVGPKNAAVSWAYLKDMYKKDGYWYVVVDYIQVVGPEETIHFVNENPLLRTFPLSKDAKLLPLKSPGSPDYKSVSVAQFKTFQAKSGDEVVEVTPKSGYAIKLKEWWAP